MAYTWLVYQFCVDRTFSVAAKCQNWVELLDYLIVYSVCKETSDVYLMIIGFIKPGHEPYLYRHVIGLSVQNFATYFSFHFKTDIASSDARKNEDVKTLEAYLLMQSLLILQIYETYCCYCNLKCCEELKHKLCLNQVSNSEQLHEPRKKSWSMLLWSSSSLRQVSLRQIRFVVI